MNIEHLSVSRSGCFDLCKQQYKFRYHLKVIPSRPEQQYFTYGKLVHTAAELYVERKGKTPIHDIVHDLLHGKIEFDGSQNINLLDQDYYKKLYAHTSYVERFTTQVGFDGEIEYEIKYDLDPPNNRLFLGYIDRLIVKNNRAIIIDYKTSKKNNYRKNKVTIKKDLQLNAYALHVHEHFGIAPENIQAALVYLEEPEVVSTNFTKKGLTDTKELLRNSYIGIENFSPDHVKGNVGYHCKRCDYNDKCSFYFSSGSV
jgi:CRISPR/Cas system-associated exonuclease Cas4 (RecB family)